MVECPKCGNASVQKAKNPFTNEMLFRCVCGWEYRSIPMRAHPNPAVRRVVAAV